MINLRNGRAGTLAALFVIGSVGVPRSPAADPPEQAAGGNKSAPVIGREWVSLFDGRTLQGWTATQFGGEGTVEVKNGELRLGIGNDLTGVNLDRRTPLTNYEVSFEAQRVEGTDFFCGLTFPVKKDPCSLIIGGWGGGVCGLSSIDSMDASENNTTKFRKFKNGRWYSIRLRVSDASIEAWMDKEKIVDQDLAGHEISIRSEVEASKPFGFASFQTLAALKNIRIRSLK